MVTKILSDGNRSPWMEAVSFLESDSLERRKNNLELIPHSCGLDERDCVFDGRLR